LIHRPIWSILNDDHWNPVLSSQNALVPDASPFLHFFHSKDIFALLLPSSLWQAKLSLIGEKGAGAEQHACLSVWPPAPERHLQISREAAASENEE